MKGAAVAYRPGPFEAPHKAIRNALSQLQLRAGRTDYTNADEVRRLRAEGADLFRIMDSHLAAENAALFHLLESRSPGAATDDIAEHRAMEVLETELRSSLEKLGDSLDREAGNDFYLAFTRFHGRYLLHIHHEETLTQSLLQEHLTPQELQGVVEEVGRNADPDELRLWFKFGMPAFSAEMRLAVLGRLRAIAPLEAMLPALHSLHGLLPDVEIEEIRSYLQTSQSEPGPAAGP